MDISVIRCATGDTVLTCLMLFLTPLGQTGYHKVHTLCMCVLWIYIYVYCVYVIYIYIYIYIYIKIDIYIYRYIHI